MLVRTVVSGQVVKYPLSEHLSSALRGTGVSYFSPTLIRPETGATVRVTSTVAGDPSAGDSSTAVWNSATLPGSLVFGGVLATTPASIRAAAALDRPARTELSLLEVIVPLAAGLAGIVALVVGILLARRRADHEPGPAGVGSGLDAAPAG